jgi:uncharacterized membrane protein YhaH (DUF805 family)
MNPDTPANNQLPIYPHTDQSNQSSTLPSEPTHSFFNGRINRLGFFVAGLYTGALLVVLFVANQAAPKHGAVSTVTVLISGLIYIGLLILTISLEIRRWHDIGKSGWLTILNFIPIVNFITDLILIFTPSKAGPNEYGLPYDGTLSIKDLFNIKR